MQLTLSSQLSQFAHVLQQELFPALAEEIGPSSERQKLFIAACVMIPCQRFLPCGKRTGRPTKSRLALAHAFLAKTIYNVAHTRQLIEVLKTDESLRKLCGFPTIGSIPHESCFSRAFAEFAKSNFAQLSHQALIEATHAQRLVGHIARDGSAIEAREHYPEEVATAKAIAKKKKTTKKGKRKGKVHIGVKQRRQDCKSEVVASKSSWPDNRSSKCSKPFLPAVTWAAKGTPKAASIIGVATNCIWM